MLSGVLDVLTSTGKHYWIPMEQVRLIEFKPAEATRDLLWRRALVEVADGPDGEVFVPAIYPWADETTDPRALLGRTTDWLGDDTTPGPVRGEGQRMFLVGDAAVPVMELGTIVINGPS